MAVTSPDPEWITASFKWCVMALRWAGARLGITYEAINIYLFVIIWPLLTVASLIGHWWQWRRNRALRRRLEGLGPLRARPAGTEAWPGCRITPDEG